MGDTSRRYKREQFVSMLRGARVVVAENVVWPRGTLHDRRRTYGACAARAVAFQVLSEHMGRAKIQTAREYYLAAETQDGNRARQALNTMLNAATTFSRDARNRAKTESGRRIQKR